MSSKRRYIKDHNLTPPGNPADFFLTQIKNVGFWYALQWTNDKTGEVFPPFAAFAGKLPEGMPESFVLPGQISNLAALCPDSILKITKSISPFEDAWRKKCQNVIRVKKAKKGQHILLSKAYICPLSSARHFEVIAYDMTGSKIICQTLHGHFCVFLPYEMEYMSIKGEKK
jgi:hypothetical protein